MWKQIETEEEFNEALKRFNEVFHAPVGTPEGDEAALLADLIETYDNEHYPIKMPEPIEVMKMRTE
jgi:HTH-type transcriptional regulator/antitoxin HigA